MKQEKNQTEISQQVISYLGEKKGRTKQNRNKNKETGNDGLDFIQSCVWSVVGLIRRKDNRSVAWSVTTNFHIHLDNDYSSNI
ncbi:hypothetical protein DERF_004477 [Dermatophagoides farinae]|uniref:Uncharacterized protein n=1 Tax=Dermatophagoides farinae TaxID=6954 RepID=A0A922I3B9_DERFA|nr:hypothetical protein DERF_004477 [Dermatophagoides farinae]